ncbi:unnamed protein product [Fraxinus pennsylvanica]|uniref:Pseudouridine synthase RsuA/RluA-like domain-containing protein n=1 Tax=Fraxinus pennsylvanica TaxID=56036 RepID=A0AAD2DU58_9LAMI|nr:unnamed protein product [Fraxinus pennsylvanica]
MWHDTGIRCSVSFIINSFFFSINLLLINFPSPKSPNFQGNLLSAGLLFLSSNFTLVQVEIYSGRPHQIRIHLSFIGHPMIEYAELEAWKTGDPLYVAGGQPKCFDPEVMDESFAHVGGYQRLENPVPGDCGYHLHAHRLIFPHPS